MGRRLGVVCLCTYACCAARTQTFEPCQAGAGKRGSPRTHRGRSPISAARNFRFSTTARRKRSGCLWARRNSPTMGKGCRSTRASFTSFVIVCRSPEVCLLNNRSQNGTRVAICLTELRAPAHPLRAKLLLPSFGRSVVAMLCLVNHRLGEPPKSQLAKFALRGSPWLKQDFTSQFMQANAADPLCISQLIAGALANIDA